MVQVFQVLLSLQPLSAAAARAKELKALQLREELLERPYRVKYEEHEEEQEEESLEDGVPAHDGREQVLDGGVVGLGGSFRGFAFGLRTFSGEGKREKRE